MRTIPFLLLLFLVVSSGTTFAQVTCVRDPYTGRWNNPRPDLGSSCTIPTSSDSSSGGSTTSTTSTGGFFDGLLWKALGLDPASQMAAKEKAARKAAMIRELERQRQEAIQRQDADRVKRLEDISRRLQSGDMRLKGLSGETDLRLKLSPTGPIRFGEYMSTPATQTTNAQLTLKTGDEATKSLQTTPNASSAGVINPNQPPAFNADGTTKEQRELADLLSKLSPEQQQKLIAAIKAAPTDAAANTASESTDASEPQPLQLKLSTPQQDADALDRAARDPNTKNEELSDQAVKDFNNLTVTPVSNATTSTDAVPISDLTSKPAILSRPNDELSRMNKQRTEVPPWRPEGWVTSASKGDRTLDFVSSARKDPGCNSAAQLEALTTLAIKSKQLAGVEIVINRLNASSPRLQSQLAQTAAEMERDRDEFVDSMISKLAGQLFEARTLVTNPEFVRMAQRLTEAKELADKVNELSNKVHTLKNESKEARAGLMKEILKETFVAFQPDKIAALRKTLGPAIEFATGWYDAAEMGINTLETFSKIVAHDLNVTNLNREIDARNRALANVLPLQKRLSDEVDDLRHAAVLTSCVPSTKKP